MYNNNDVRERPKIFPQMESISKNSPQPQQDYLLWNLRQNGHVQSWKLIATEINRTVEGSEKTGKQCRERYTNYARFRQQDIGQNERWSDEQDDLLFRKFMKYGPKWVLISSQLTDKSENMVKNRFHNALGRIQRKIRKIQLKRKIKNKKPITTKRLVKIFHELGLYIDEQQGHLAPNEPLPHRLHLFCQLAHDLIRMGRQNVGESSEQEIYSIISLIHQFQLVLRGSEMTHDSKPSKRSKKQSQDSHIFSSSAAISQEESGKLDKELSSGAEKSFPDKKSFNGCQLEVEQLSLFPELSQQQYKVRGSKNLWEEVCLIENREYIPECCPFLQ